MDGTATGVVNVGGTLTAAAGAVATIGRVTITVTGISTINGQLLFSSVTGIKTLTGDVTINNGGSVYFSAAPTVTLSGNLFMNGTSSIDGHYSSVNVGLAFNVNSGASATLGNVTFAVSGASTVTGTLIISNAAGTYNLNGGATLANSGNITFSAAATLTIGTSLACNGTNSITYSAAGRQLHAVVLVPHVPPLICGDAQRGAHSFQRGLTPRAL